MEIKEKVKEIVRSHNLLCLCTMDENGLPKGRSVDYASGEDESVLYFFTHGMSDKVREIENNPHVYVVIDHDCPAMEELQKLRYIKG